MKWRLVNIAVLTTMLFLGAAFLNCVREEVSEAVTPPSIDSAYAERLRKAEERIHNLEIQMQLLAEGERERAALLHGFGEIGNRPLIFTEDECTGWFKIVNDERLQYNNGMWEKSSCPTV